MRTPNFGDSSSPFISRAQRFCKVSSETFDASAPHLYANSGLNLSKSTFSQSTTESACCSVLTTLSARRSSSSSTALANASTSIERPLYRAMLRPFSCNWSMADTSASRFRRFCLPREKAERPLNTRTATHLIPSDVIEIALFSFISSPPTARRQDLRFQGTFVPDPDVDLVGVMYPTHRCAAHSPWVARPRSRSAGRPRHGPSRRSRWWWRVGTSSGPLGCTWRRPTPSCIPRPGAQPEALLDRRDELLADLGLHRLPVPAGLASDRRDHVPELLRHFHLGHHSSWRTVAMATVVDVRSVTRTAAGAVDPPSSAAATVLNVTNVKISS